MELLGKLRYVFTGGLVMMNLMKRAVAGASLAAVLLVGQAMQPAKAITIGLLILEGSDSQALHGLDPYSTNFLNGMATFSTAPTLPIAILNGNPVGTPTVGKVVLGNQPGSVPDLATMIASYSGIYVGSPFSCCDESPLGPGEGAILRAFLEAGRSVAIVDYQGGAQFDEVIGITGADAGTANAHVDGYGGGTNNLGGCFDGNIVAPGGAALFGVPVGSAIPNIGCFGHQAYEEAFFDKYGLTTYIAVNPGLPGYNVVISNGGGGLIDVIDGVPEPASIALLGAALVGIGVARRRS